MTEQLTAPEAKQKSGWLNLAVDYGPIVIFFLVYRWYSPAKDTNTVAQMGAVIAGTAAFMVSAVIALAISRWKLGKVSPMLLLSTALIVGFGALTVFFHDPFWVQIKPTAIYLIFGISLLVGAMRGRPLLRYLLEAAFEGMDQAGWLKLSRNWGLFFLGLAALNEAMRHTLSFGDWLGAKLWVFLPLSFLFTFSQLPMMMRHGFGKEDAAPVPPGE